MRENARWHNQRFRWVAQDVPNGEAIQNRSDSDRSLSPALTHDSMPPLEDYENMVLPTMNRSDSNEDTLILEQPDANRYC